MTTTRDTIAAFYANFKARDFVNMRTLLHDDLSFQGPMATIDNADEFVTALGGFAKMTKGIEVKHVFVDGDRACCVYDLVTDGPIGTRPVAEYFELHGGRISAIRSHFDARPK